MPLPLWMALELAMNRPARFRLVNLGKKTAASQSNPAQPGQGTW